ncbi:MULTISPECIES: hypothetical protein [Listeria]|uniref:hypothetical protein n=1 Tax=Listeria TaxID=1637 RepID=UPI000B58E39A|nr:MULTISPECIES: hypothetical protein [Listeria]
MKIFKLVDQISFESALAKISLHQAYETLNGTGKELLPKTLKIYVFAAISWLICFFSSNNWFVFPIIATLVIVGIIVGYFRSNLYFKKAGYNVAVYLFVQTALVFYIASSEISGSLMLNRTVSLVYILVCYYLSLYVVKVKLIECVQVKYLFNDSKKIKMSRAIKAVKILSSTLIAFIVILIAIMQFFRFNKSWIEGANYDFLSGLNGTFMGTVVAGFSIAIGISVLFLISLLPTLLFNAAFVADGLILRKYSENFRKQYEFTENEWYGEK